MNELFERLWALRPLGNKMSTKSEYDYIVATKKSTGNELIQKFAEYLAYCKYTERNEKYVKGALHRLIHGAFSHLC